MSDGPKGELAIRTIAMPENTNPDGHIFGGWVISQMDLAGLYMARSYTDGRCVTVAIDSMIFISPVHVGDFVCCYCSIEKIGRTSLHIRIEAWALSSRATANRRKVTEGVFVFVAVDENQKPQPLIKSE
jgi:acyl-CoA thioesterase YciA